MSCALLLGVFGINASAMASVTVSLTSPANNTVATAPASFTLTATASSSNSTIKNVAFYNGTTLLATVTTAPYTYTWSNVAAGTYSITAKATDNKNATATSTAVTVISNAAPTVSLTSPANNAVSTYPGSFTLTASASDSDGSIAKVEFYNGTTLLGTATSSPYSYTWSNVPVGSYNLTAKATDNRGAVTTSAAVAVSTTQATSTSALSVTPNPATIGQITTLTAAVTGASPSGSVTFKDGATVLGAGTLSAGTATLGYAFNTVGTHSITATYGGDTNNTASTSAATNLTINQATSTSALTVTPNPSQVGQATTLNATVNGLNATGTVTFKDGANTLGTANLASGAASLSYAFTSAGAHSITAVYAGDTNNASSTSTATALTVNAATSTTTLSAAQNPATAGQTTTMTATISGANPSGTVTFKDGTTTLGTGTLNAGSASLSYTFNIAGAHSITAEYAGDANNAASTSTATALTVNIATSSTTLSATPNPATAGQATTLTANVAGVNATGTVTFKDGTTTLGTGTLNAGSTSLSYTFNIAGAHSITAEYAGDANNAASTSTATALTVNTAASTTTISVTPSPAIAGQAVTLTANVAGVNATGTVTFKDGTSTLGTGTLNAGSTSLSYTFNIAGAHSITAEYAGDANNAASTATATALTVSVAASTTAVSATPSPATAGQTTTLIANVAGVNATGTVTFKDGTTTLGTGTLNAGSASLSYTFTTAGAHSIAAEYAGDTNNAASTSTATALTVNTATSTTTISATPNPATAGQATTLSASVAGANASGNVTFKDGATTLGSSALTGGAASLSYTFTTAGAHSITAEYAGDANNAASTSTATALTVSVATSTTALNVNPNPVILGQTVTLTATVSGTNPGGSVTFLDGTNTVGTATLTAGSTSFSYTFTSASTHSLTAVYAGDTNNSGSTSTANNVTVNPATSTTALTVTPNPANVGQAVTLTAAVTGLSPTGSVTFLDGSTTLGTANLAAGSATVSYTFSTIGNHSLTASYAGDASNSGGQSAPVNVTINSGVAQAYYIHTDQLNTPRSITDGNGNVVWQWDNTDPFGNNIPNENPNGAGQFSFNLRFPGQYFDRETNTHYNINRDYDPSIGRYVQSDPIGLAGGSFSTYAYVGENPLKYTDPWGLESTIPGPHGNGEKWTPADPQKVKELICQGAKNGGFLDRDPSSRDMSLVYAEHYWLQYQNVKNHPNLYGFWWWAPFFYEPSKEMWPTYYVNDKDTSPPTPEAIVWAQRGAEDFFFGKSLDDLRKKYCGCH